MTMIIFSSKVTAFPKYGTHQLWEELLVKLTQPEERANEDRSLSTDYCCFLC